MGYDRGIHGRVMGHEEETWMYGDEYEEVYCGLGAERSCRPSSRCWYNTNGPTLHLPPALPSNQALILVDIRHIHTYNHPSQRTPDHACHAYYTASSTSAPLHHARYQSCPAANSIYFPCRCLCFGFSEQII